ncbi:MAG TPA: pilus assembly protein [Hyphomicrobiaceae bacterium]|nr:pilus assembly protein [Hyphomicrobiaceae bacterium]
METMLASRGARGFFKAEEGTVAILFALCAIPVFLTVGLAFDFGRVYHAERKLSGAIDAAVLAAAKALRDGRASDDQVTAVAEEFFQENMRGSGGSYARVKAFNIVIDRASNAVTADVDADVPTVFFKIAGFEKVSVPKSSAAVYDVKDIELGLQLDVTGSMAGRKLSDLKSAVGDLLEIMLPDGGSTNRVRIGLAPFAAGVNAGGYARAVSGGRATDGCVYERRLPTDQSSEAPPMGTLALKARADLGGASACPTNARVMALTNDRDALRSEVARWTAGGSTAGHLGAAWAWYLVSPEWSSIWPGASRPAPYSSAGTTKAVILMTDGIYNTVGGVNHGDYSPTATRSTRFAQETCEAMRAQGIVVYTIGFEAPSAAKDALKACASGSSKFYDAANGDELREAFRAIAAELNNLRLAM